MNDFEKIENKCLGNRGLFCEFLGCLYNKGMCDISVDYKDGMNFYFHRSSEAFGINDAFICSDDSDYISGVLGSCGELTTAVIIPSGDFDTKRYENSWKVGVRRQFYKSCLSSEPVSDGGYIRLDRTHFSVISESSSDVVKRNYAMSLDFDEACYAVIDGGLKCFLSTGSNKKTNMTEITWIYTEPEYRNKGYASDLLRKVSDCCVSEGVMMTYHCRFENAASANTALKAGFTETVNEIILEKR